MRHVLEGPPAKVAVALLGWHLEANGVVVRLDDVEAYGGFDDAASHAFRGERIANRSMFGPAGHLYVYLSHGIHDCANVVCGLPGDPSAVLLRGGLVLEGAEVAAARRARALPRGRLDGPGRLCQGMGISRLDDGVDLLDPTSPVRLVRGELGACEQVTSTPRIGLTKEVDRLWRFHVVPRPDARTAPK